MSTIMVAIVKFYSSVALITGDNEKLPTLTLPHPLFLRFCHELSLTHPVDPTTKSVTLHTLAGDIEIYNEDFGHPHETNI